MELQECVVALSMIDKRRWCNASSKVDLVVLVAVGEARQPGDLVPLGQRDAALLTGMDRWWCYGVLEELLEERVLVMTDDAAGSRGRCYAVNPTVRAWRVTWRVDLERVLTRLDLLSGRLVTAKTRVATRHGASLSAFVTRHGASQFRACDAPWRVTNGSPATRHGASQTLGRLARAPSCLDSLSSSEDEEHETPPDAASEAQERLARAIRDRTGSVVGGSLPDRLSTALAGCSEDQVDELERRVRDHPHKVGAPLLVQAVEQFAQDLRATPAVRSFRVDPAEATAELLAGERAVEPAPPPDWMRGFRDRVRESVTGGCDNDEDRQ